MRTALAAAAALSLLAAPAFAQSLAAPTYYGALGYTWFDGQDANLGEITGRVGAKLHRYFGVEGEGSFGVKDDDFAVSINGAGKYRLRYDLAAYAVGFLPVTDKFDLFARLGYGTTKIRASVSGVKSLQDGESVNYGLGGSYLFDGSNGVRLDWTRRDFTDSHAHDADTWAISYIRKF
jgi:outer membrane immunogenic protein